MPPRAHDRIDRAIATRLQADGRIANVDLAEAVSLSPQTGQPFGSQSMSAGGFLGPVIADNTLYLLTDDANLSAYR